MLKSRGFRHDACKASNKIFIIFHNIPNSASDANRTNDAGAVKETLVADAKPPTHESLPAYIDRPIHTAK